MEKKQVDNMNLRLLVFSSAKELGEKVDRHLLKKYDLSPDEYTFILPISERFFEDGHLKIEINSTVRGKEIFALTDIGNYSITYKMHGFFNHMSPNDLLMQLKDGIGACNSHADKINIIMPLLYAGRQHRRNIRENLLCGQTLHEIELNKHIRSIITFDAHDQGVEHALTDIEFDNFYPSNVILKRLINDLDVEDLKRLTIVAPDNGAAGRRNVILNSLNSDYVNIEAGSFIKQRDYNIVVDGANPIISHDYCGNNDLKGKTAIIVDDMISSGSSMFDCIDRLKELGIKKLFIIVTYALFTRGVDKFNEYYKANKFDGVYTTNLSYIPKEYESLEWLKVCDCSEVVADAIYKINSNNSITKLIKDKSEPIRLVDSKFEENKRK